MAQQAPQSPQETISSAVNLALGATSSNEQRAEAYRFLEQVKANATETWTECLKLVLANKQYSGEARHFALQVLDDALGNGWVHMLVPPSRRVSA